MAFSPPVLNLVALAQSLLPSSGVLSACPVSPEGFLFCFSTPVNICYQFPQLSSSCAGFRVPFWKLLGPGNYPLYYNSITGPDFFPHFLFPSIVMQREGRLLNVRRILYWVAGYLSSSSWFLEISLPTLPTPNHTVFPPAKSRRRTRSVREIQKGVLAKAVKGGPGRIQRLWPWKGGKRSIPPP